MNTYLVYYCDDKYNGCAVENGTRAVWKSWGLKSTSSLRTSENKNTMWALKTGGGSAIFKCTSPTGVIDGSGS